jgi:transcriptional regulator with XRE-family HTH domain
MFIPNHNSVLNIKEMEQLIKLGQQINKRREQLKLSQLDLAEITQLSDATIRSIEKGRPTVAIGNWVKVADVLGMDVVLQTKKMSDETRKSI